MSTKAFPPANDAIAFAIDFYSNTDWQKVRQTSFTFLKKAITIILTICAILYVLGRMCGEWWYGGGREDVIRFYNKLRAFAQVIRQETISAYDDILTLMRACDVYIEEPFNMSYANWKLVDLRIVAKDMKLRTNLRKGQIVEIVEA